MSYLSLLRRIWLRLKEDLVTNTKPLNKGPEDSGRGGWIGESTEVFTEIVTFRVQNTRVTLIRCLNVSRTPVYFSGLGGRGCGYVSRILFGRSASPSVLT